MFLCYFSHFLTSSCCSLSQCTYSCVVSSSYLGCQSCSFHVNPGLLLFVLISFSSLSLSWHLYLTVSRWLVYALFFAVWRVFSHRDSDLLEKETVLSCLVSGARHSVGFRYWVQSCAIVVHSVFLLGSQLVSCHLNFSPGSYVKLFTNFLELSLKFVLSASFWAE